MSRYVTPAQSFLRGQHVCLPDVHSFDSPFAAFLRDKGAFVQPEATRETRYVVTFRPMEQLPALVRAGVHAALELSGAVYLSSQDVRTALLARTHRLACDQANTGHLAAAPPTGFVGV